MRSSIRLVTLAAALAFAGTASACGGRIDSDKVTERPSHAHDEGADRPDHSRPSGAAMARADGNCTEDFECSEDPAAPGSLGRCWKKSPTEGSCVCLEGATMQPSGRCGITPAPSCSAQGGSCVPWATCSQRNGSQADTTASAECAGSNDTVCCVPQASCRETNIDYCYRKGTDEAYAPPCINGWITCHAGDSPDLDI